MNMLESISLKLETVQLVNQMLVLLCIDCCIRNFDKLSSVILTSTEELVIWN